MQVSFRIFVSKDAMPRYYISLETPVQNLLRDGLNVKTQKLNWPAVTLRSSINKKTEKMGNAVLNISSMDGGRP